MTNNNSSRTLVNLLGIPSLLAIIYLGDSYSNIPIFSIFISIVLLLGALEVAPLTNSKNGEPVISVLLLFLALLQIGRIPGINWEIPIHILIIGLTFTAMALEIFRKKETPLLNISILVFSFVWLGLMLGSLSELRNLPDIGFKVTLAIFLSVWICDTGAFFFGKKFGKKKILPNVSPNKTWVGTIAGFFFSLVFLLIINRDGLFLDIFSTIDVIVLAIITGIFGQFGDWAESLLKREAGVKDSSNILAGHGGILDRFDSLTFAAPLALIYCTYFIKAG
ncbi:MAG: phosphatidate cytidylyltransferase [Candidatus Marinimicrobia bacterium]|nr:phosphatidate cytidylyltransferase [Candidatus Neomarinimicrobiota bacterium]